MDRRKHSRSERLIVGLLELFHQHSMMTLLWGGPISFWDEADRAEISGGTSQPWYIHGLSSQSCRTHFLGSREPKQNFEELDSWAILIAWNLHLSLERLEEPDRELILFIDPWGYRFTGKFKDVTINYSMVLTLYYVCSGYAFRSEACDYSQTWVLSSRSLITLYILHSVPQRVIQTGRSGSTVFSASLHAKIDSYENLDRSGILSWPSSKTI